MTDKKLSAGEVLSNLLSDDEMLPDTDDLLELLMHDSDRGCVLALTAFLDDALEHAIRKKLTDLSAVSRDDLDFLLTKRPNPPLGTFGVRIVMARSLSIIDDKTQQALKAIQKLRNPHAHSWASFKLTHSDLDGIERQMDLSPSEELVREVEKGMVRDYGDEEPWGSHHWRSRLINIVLRFARILTHHEWGPDVTSTPSPPATH